ncbi:MAG: ribonuclease HII, partial [Actinomycetota bacterium]
MEVNASPRRPSTEWERRVRASGWSLVAGVDEAGRGPLAGPVVA